MSGPIRAGSTAAIVAERDLVQGAADYVGTVELDDDRTCLDDHLERPQRRATAVDLVPPPVGFLPLEERPSASVLVIVLVWVRSSSRT